MQKSDKVNAARLAEVSQVTQLVDADKIPWYKKKNLRLLYLTLVPSALGVEMTSGYDGSVLNGLQAVQPWLDDFNNPSGSILGILSAAFPLGSVIAIPFVPWFTDRFGRKASIKFGTVLIIIGAVLQTASVNYGMFLASRFVLGTGIPFAISGASQLLAELCYPKERSVITGLFNESWYVGSILAAAVTLGTFAMKSSWAWRIPSLLQLLPSLLQIIFIWFVPESPRWLISKDRSEEALEILIKYHAEGDRESVLVHTEFQQIRDTLRLEAEASQHSYREMLTTKANLRRMLIASCVGLFSQWSGNGLVSYYLAKILSSIGISSQLQQNRINLGLQCWNLVSGSSGAFLTAYLGRRAQYLIAYTGMTIVFACWTGASAVFANDNHNNQAAGAVVGMIFIYYGCYNLMHPLTYIYITEIFPYISRSKGVATTQFFTRAGSAFNLFVNPIGIQQLAWKFYLVYVAWLFVETSVIALVYPETKGPSLEELAIVFEGKDAHVSMFDMDKPPQVADHVEKV